MNSVHLNLKCSKAQNLFCFFGTTEVIPFYSSRSWTVYTNSKNALFSSGQSDIYWQMRGAVRHNTIELLMPMLLKQGQADPYTTGTAAAQTAPREAIPNIYV